ncbi:B3 domain-containing transcription repressor VAL1 isoform X2 [Coffea arabica]|uniref:B3 domain-containing transcription repressor VAL1 isoform X2 n=1 Tax=Coffea arabica TaxID=13443 RepID=A0A6P6ULB5_COFAR|nr:B3 domain-containing transcription repressor VAL1-like isoform X2 [Coffea arabica]
MGSKICMNEACRLTTSPEWKQGWGLKSGGFATLCSSCGTAYENLVFCEKFHLDEDGWRECKICRKRIHCGCVASKMLHEFLDFGGVGCITCVKQMDTPSLRTVKILGDEIPNGTIGHRSFDSLLQLCNNVEVNGSKKMFKPHRVGTNASLGQKKGEGTALPFEQVNTSSPNFTPQSVGSSMFVKPEISRQNQGFKDMAESLAQPSVNFSLSNALSASGSALPISEGIVEGSEQNRVSTAQQGQRARQILPKPPKPGSSVGSENTKGMGSQTRIARPPAEGRGRSQLLPRYWPRITDQELQQISGDLKSTVVPLFEKVLSASDAGRIGRLVLPKACAEAYFPPINQSEGLPIRIQDVKGKEWTFQFRFWPNNNSRMYVLEGVTPCIQNMQLQAGDTVTFSRIDPGGQLVMGFRKSTTNVETQTQDPQPSGLPNGGSPGETSYLGASDNMLAISENGNNGGQIHEDSSQRNILIPEKKKARNIGLKNKRLLMHSDDAMELRVTWEEAQELLRPPTNSPTIIKIEDCEFEEYDEPPIFGKRTIFTVQPSGQQEQWAQCDNCSKWRRLPMHVLVPARWTCPDNAWVSNSSCSAPDDINPRELEALNIASKDFKRRRIVETKVAEDYEPSGLDALATAAVLGDNMGDLTEMSVGATTKHPRHRPGCSCIVCIQPPSGKGKHPTSCKCNVCLTVKRRFKTLMMRKKKRQSDREAELLQGKDEETPPLDMSEMEGAAEHALLLTNHSDAERSQNGSLMEAGESNKGQLDLNCHPSREEDMLAEAAAGINLATLIDAASIPLDVYMRQDGVASVSHHLLPSHAPGDGEGSLPEEGCSASANMGPEKKGKEE